MPTGSTIPSGLRQRKGGLGEGTKRQEACHDHCGGTGLSDHQMTGSLALGACLYILLGDRLATAWPEEPALS